MHLPREQLGAVLRRCRAAVVDGGILGCTLKEGDGEQWTEEKIGLPRHFTYWREAPSREVLARADWTVLSLDRVAGHTASWIYVIARAVAG
ncbi:MAG TPA: hypothetical protein VE733_27635 [Streptosporangiaceae bacterium]|nr:hypothetical protein [Streptosporangiaceae bacterium]